MKDDQCYELFRGIALKNHAFSFLIFKYEQKLCVLTVYIVIGITSVHIIMTMSYGYHISAT